jgi:hypothetical protein
VSASSRRALLAAVVVTLLSGCGADGPDVDPPNPPAGPRDCKLLDALAGPADTLPPGCQMTTTTEPECIAGFVGQSECDTE